MLKVHFYRPQKGIGQNNFGDMLAPIILKWLTGQDIVWVPSKTPKKILCIGSELNNNVAQEHDIIWGYGAKKEQIITLPGTTKVLAVRGPKTQKLIQNNIGNIPLGDPACIMPLIYKPKTLSAHYKIGIIPHYIDKKLFNINDSSMVLIDINSNVFDIIDLINSCDLIISTSLHGAIVSEAYKKPVVWLKVSDNIKGLIFKWNDYILGTGRKEQMPIELNKENITSQDIYNSNIKTMGKPIFNQEQLIKAWKQYANTL
jgi:pyruvyltransferase